MTEFAPAWYVDSADKLSAWLDRLADAELIAVDTESDSFHHYREKVCLIQMTACGEDAIIDPLAFDGMQALASLFADPRRTKVFHDAGYDLMCLQRDFGFEVAGLFDTMLASRLLGQEKFGLAAILLERFGYEANKRLQRSDWARRPLTPAQIAYAQHDTHFLPELVGQLTHELETAGRLAWAQEDFARLPEIAARNAARDSRRDPDAFWRMRGVRALSPVARGRIKELYLVREKIAERLDRPPFKVFGDAVIKELARKPPQSPDDLPRRGLRRAGVERFGTEIMAALERATPIQGKPPAGVGRRQRSGRLLDPQARRRYEALRRLRREKATHLGLDPEVLLGNATLEGVAKHAPATLDALLEESQFCGWRQPVLAKDVLRLVELDAEQTPAR